jgi:hypothetical protein
MEDNNRINKGKRKQSSLTVAAMSMGVSADALDKVAAVVFAYNRFYNERTEENFLFFLDMHEIAKLEAHGMYLSETINKIQNSKKSNGQNK